MPPRVRPGEVRWDDAAVAAPITRLTTTGLARRYSVSSRTIERWERDPRLHLPEALHINKRKYRDVAALEVWESLTQVARRFLQEVSSAASYDEGAAIVSAFDLTPFPPRWAEDIREQVQDILAELPGEGEPP